MVILGSGTLKDLSLVMLIGMLVGAYSSVFVAVPIAVDLKLTDPAIKAHTLRVEAKRKAEGLIVDADGDPIRRIARPSAGGTAVAAARVAATPSNLKPGAAPKPGVKPARPAVRPAPVTGSGSSKAGARPSGKGGRPTGKRSR